MKRERFYHITSLHKDDLREAYNDSDTGNIPMEIGGKIGALSDTEMEYIASKLSDAFCNCCFWDALRMYFEMCSPDAGKTSGVDAAAKSTAKEAGKGNK